MNRWTASDALDPMFEKPPTGQVVRRSRRSRRTRFEPELIRRLNSPDMETTSDFTQPTGLLCSTFEIVAL
jgi:hypothetical protein